MQSEDPTALQQACASFHQISLKYNVPGPVVNEARSRVNNLLREVAEGEPLVQLPTPQSERASRRLEYGQVPWKEVELEDGSKLSYMPPKFILQKSMEFNKFRVAIDQYLQTKSDFLEAKGVFKVNLHGSSLRNNPCVKQPTYVPVQWYMDEVVPKNHVARQVEENLMVFAFAWDIDTVQSFKKFGEGCIFPFAIMRKKDSSTENVNRVVRTIIAEFEETESFGIDVSDHSARPGKVDIRAAPRNPGDEVVPTERIKCGLSVLTGDNPGKSKICGVMQQGSARKQCWFCDCKFPHSRSHRIHRIAPFLFDQAPHRTDESIKADLEKARLHLFDRTMEEVRPHTLMHSLSNHFPFTSPTSAGPEHRLQR
jgi:hypothetical protein